MHFESEYSRVLESDGNATVCIVLDGELGKNISLMVDSANHATNAGTYESQLSSPDTHCLKPKSLIL